MVNFSSFTSASFSYSTSSSDGQQSGRAYRKESASTPQGSTTRTTTQNLGERPVQETRHFDAQGRELLGSGQPHTRGAIQQGGGGRVEEVQDDETDADRTYRERMEDEYAKREGGA